VTTTLPSLPEHGLTATETVVVEPAGITIEVNSGESVMDAAQRAGYRWPTVCGGTGECKTCVFEIVSGEDALVAPTSSEQDALDKTFRLATRRGQRLRLACQSRVAGAGLVIRKRGVTPAEDRAKVTK
jgi:ferredoxin, 2Fe-2S